MGRDPWDQRGTPSSINGGWMRLRHEQYLKMHQANAPQADTPNQPIMQSPEASTHPVVTDLQSIAGSQLALTMGYLADGTYAEAAGHRDDTAILDLVGLPITRRNSGAPGGHAGEHVGEASNLGPGEKAPGVDGKTEGSKKRKVGGK